MEFYKYLDNRLIDIIKYHPNFENITEIRLKNNSNISLTVNGQNEIVKDIYVSTEELENVFYNMCQQSQNVYEDEISNGYITLKEGHRVGIGGEFYYNCNTGKNILKHLDSLTIRISKEIMCFENQEKLFSLVPESTLFVGPPHSGKTSLLKLYAEHIGEKNRVIICDERKELCSRKTGCNVIAGIKKATAITMATRTLNPQFIICDEIGSEQEADEILSAVNTGVKFICSAHGNDMESINKRPNIRKLLKENIFNRIVFLRQIDSKFYIEDINDI